MVASLRAYWREAAPYQRFAYGVGALLALSGLFHAVVFLVTGGPWQGPVSWRKAVTFGLSFGVTTVSVAWVLTFLPRRPRLGWLLMGLFGLANVIEVTAVSLQAWRRTPSHFNTSTPFDAVVFSTMGASVAVIALVIVAVTVWSLRSLRAPRSLALAIRTGLVLLVVSQAAGYAIIANGQSILEQESVDTPAATTRDLSHVGEGGALKVPHAATIHALQVLPALAWFSQFVAWSERRRTRLVGAAAAGYIGLCLVSVWQTARGLGATSLDPLASVVVVASAGLVAAAFAVVFLALARGRRPLPA
jgi:hypothetical protein